MRIKTMIPVLATIATALFFMGAAQAADIVETIAATPNLKTLSAAIKAAGMGDTLKGKGPFTVFAPTDEAFKRLTAESLANLMKPENKEQLVKLLTFHVLPAKVTEKDMNGKMYKTKTLNGKDVEIDADDPGEGIRINKAKVTTGDIAADNGVIHLINRVLVP
jgi:uncharacterized surface protein with fasciclin (FAS1) repeats